MKRHLVVGASGTVGSGVVESLGRRGEAVRAATSKEPRTREASGVEWVRLDLGTGAGLEEAFAGVDRAFLMSPPGHADQHRILSPLIREATKRKLEKVVLMTAFGANAVETAPFRRAEIELERSSLAYNVVRPNWFMQNFGTFWAAGINAQGKVRLPAGTARVSFIDARDISAVAVRLLTTDDLGNGAFDLTGEEALDHAEAARAISEACGRKITYEDIDPEEMKKGLLAAGLPADYVDFMLMIFGFLRQGYNARVTGEVKRILGRDPIRFERYARDFAACWKAAA